MKIIIPIGLKDPDEVPEELLEEDELDDDLLEEELPPLLRLEELPPARASTESICNRILQNRRLIQMNQRSFLFIKESIEKMKNIIYRELNFLLAIFFS